LIKVTVTNEDGDGVSIDVIDRGFHAEELQVVDIIRRALKEEEYDMVSTFTDET